MSIRSRCVLCSRRTVNDIESRGNRLLRSDRELGRTVRCRGNFQLSELGLSSERVKKTLLPNRFRVGHMVPQYKVQSGTKLCCMIEKSFFKRRSSNIIVAPAANLLASLSPTPCVISPCNSASTAARFYFARIPSPNSLFPTNGVSCNTGVVHSTTTCKI